MNAVLTDWSALVGRHLLHLRRMPDKLVSATVLPMVFVVLFGVLFGSAITIPGGDYGEFIMAGIFTQVMITAVPNTALGTLEDLGNGLVDRFRSLPMSPSAVLVGRTVGDTALRAVTCVAMTAVGYAIGWRLEGGVLAAIAGFGVLLLFGFTMAWLGALLGMKVKSPEAAASLPSLLLMPLMFLSSAYVPLGGLPAWLRAIAEWNPISAVASACRALWGNPAAAGDSFAARNPIPLALAWLALALLVIVPLAVRKYRSATV
ncbi:ABC transporter permease [Saccharothrix hoggarensis]|uniref:Transport permease protein n=1 Tax=Saccharothrix hoggarensis TaxID=913853 RepID=A0ABW3QSG6_9PSEU